MCKPRFQIPVINANDIIIAKELSDKPNLNVTVRKRLRVIALAFDSHGQPRTVQNIAEFANVSENTVLAVLRMYAEAGGMEPLFKISRVLNQDVARQKIDGRMEAEILSIACTDPPEGYTRWTLELLTKEVNERIASEIDLVFSESSIGRVLQRNKLKPHLSKIWCITQVDANYIRCMEDILDVYERPYNPRIVLICMDEKPFQFLGDLFLPIPMAPGHPRKQDDTYIRLGTCSIFTFIEPHTGRIHASARDHRTRLDWAEEIKYMCDVLYPDAEKIVLVCDNLNTHNLDTLYQKYGAVEGHRLCNRIELHYTPKHASWLNIAEIGINILTKMCLDRRIPGMDMLTREMAAWEKDYNAMGRKINWQFTTADARIKLSHLYPTFDPKTESYVWPKTAQRSQITKKPSNKSKIDEEAENEAEAEAEDAGDILEDVV